MESKKNKNNFLLGRFKGGIIATKGAFKFMTSEPSAMIQLVLFVFVSIAALFYKFSAVEWILHIIVWGMILVSEAINTAIEKLCDFVHEEFHSKIGFIKDIAAGAVWFAAMTALIVEIIIFYPKIF
jgi:diacylglycerol kinase (ATP)